MRLDLALARAANAWGARVWDPPVVATTPDAVRCKAAITTYIKSGLGWKSWEKPAGKTWTEYQGDLNFSWCGAHVAWLLAGAGLKAPIRLKYLASTFRLREYGRLDAHRIVEPKDMRPGDIAVVGRDKPEGDHITWVVHRSPNYYSSHEGNGTGMFPDGTVGQGVVRNIRPISDVVHAYRPLTGDYEVE